MTEEQLPYHQQRALRKSGMLPRLPTRKEKRPIKPISEKKRAAMKQDKEAGRAKPISKLELDKWFDDIAKKHCSELGGSWCMECGRWIHPNFMRHATAHLLAKKLFKSVATHPLNYLVLGAGCGCHEETHRVDKFIKMKCWPEAARRIKEMIPLLPIDELRHISSQLLKALDNTP